MNKTIALAIAIAGLSWIFGLFIYHSYSDPTWQCLASLAITDFIFMLIFCYSTVNSDKVRWICTLLAIAIFFTLLSSITFYSYQHGIVEQDFFAVNWVLSYYREMCFTLSLLIMIVSALNDRIMDNLDGLFWPPFANSFRYNFDVWRFTNTKKGAF